MARGSAQVFSNLGRGLNTQASPYDLEAGESPDCLNVRGTVRGAIRKREGFVDLGNGTNLDSQPRKLAIYQQGATSKIVALGLKLQAFEPGGAPSAAFSPATTSPWTWSSALGRPMGSPLQGPLFLMSDTDKLVFDGTSFSTWTAASGTIPTGRMMAAHQNRLFVADLSTSRTGVAFSEIGDYRTWPVANIVEFDPTEQDRITAICSLGQSLMVFKRDAIYRVHDSDNGANTRITDEAGTTFRDSVVATDQGCFFLDANHGVMVTNGSTVTAVSDAILPELRGLPLDDEATFSVSAAYWEGSYWLSIPNVSGVPAVLFEYDLQAKAWWRHNCPAYDLKTAPFPQAADPALKRDVLIGAVPGPVLARLGVAPTTTRRVFHLMRPKAAADLVVGVGATPIAFRWRSAPHTVDGNPSRGKRLSHLAVDAVGDATVWQLRNYSAAVERIGDLVAAGGTEPGLWGVPRAGLWGVPRGNYAWGGAGPNALSRFYTLGVARAWQLEIRGLSVSDFELDSYSLYVGPRPRKN